MIANAKRLENGVVIYRRGMGYFLKLRALLLSVFSKISLKNLYIYVIKEYTDIKHAWLFLLFKSKQMPKILNQVIEFNTIKSVNNEGKLISDTQAVLQAVDLLASAYGWTPDYILENIDYQAFSELAGLIDKREISQNKMKLIIQHSPKQANEILQKASKIENKRMSDIQTEINNNPDLKAKIKARIEARNGR